MLRVFIRYCGYELYTYADPSESISDSVCNAICERVHDRKLIGEMKYKETIIDNTITFEQLGVQDDDLIYVSRYCKSKGDFKQGSNVLLYNKQRTYRGQRRDYQNWY